MVATATTNQRKLLHVYGSYSRPDAYHLVYQSLGEVWYTRSTNSGTTWSSEVLISRGTGTALNPSIAEPRYWGDDTTYVVWLDTEQIGGQTKHSVFFKKISLVTGQLTSIEKVEFGGAQYWARPNATPVAVRLGAMPNYPDVTVAFEAENAGIVAAHRYYYGSNGIIWWGTQLQGTSVNSAKPSMAISFDVSPYNVSIAYDEGGLIYFATSDAAHQTPVIFGTPVKISSDQFSGNQCPSLAVSPGNEKYVSWISQDWYTGCGFTIARRWDSAYGWSVVSGFIDDLGDPTYLTTSICAHDIFPGATMFWSDRSVLANMVSPDGYKWTTSSLSAASIDFPNLSALADPFTIASVLTKINQAPYEVKFELRNNGNYFGPLAKGNGLDSLEELTRLYRRIDLRDTSSEEIITALFGEIKLLSQGGDVLRKLRFAKPLSAHDALRTAAFQLESARKIELEFGLAERNWRREITFTVDLIDSASGRVADRLVSRSGRGNGHPGFRGRIQKNIPPRPPAGPVYLILQFSGNGLEGYEQYMTNYVVVGRKGLIFKQDGGAEGQSVKPTVFALHSNYPNPFNPTTTLNYDLPEAANISLVVYDVLGRKVVELANGLHEAGYHLATWNASNVASGVYFTRFTAMDVSGDVKFSKINKLVLMK